MRKGTAHRKGKETRKTIREKVFELIKNKGKISTYGIKNCLRIKIHSISGRLSELEQDGLIYQICRVGKGRESNTVWKDTPTNLIELKKAENWNKRQILWLQKGLNNKFISKKDFKNLDKQSTLF